MDLSIVPLQFRLNDKENVMSASGMRGIGRVTIWFVAAAFSHLAFAQAKSRNVPSAAKERARIVFSHSLPKLDGDRLKATVLEVTYGPGESSPPHSHPCAVIGYVERGAIRTQVKGQLEAIVKAGESFYEAPNGIHLVSANASQTEPASFTAFFVCDHDAPLSADVPPTMTPGGR
jgi:quercetin dioxygenase-like cupin family protein